MFMNNESSPDLIAHRGNCGVCEEDLMISFDMGGFDCGSQTAGNFLTVRLHLAGYLPTLANLQPAFQPSSLDLKLTKDA